MWRSRHQFNAYTLTQILLLVIVALCLFVVRLLHGLVDLSVRRIFSDACMST